MAQQALTVQTASGGRFSLGIGLSHQLVIEGMFGLSYEKPARHMRAYLEVLGPLLRGESLQQAGDAYTWRGSLQFDAPPVPLIVAALGPVMLRIAGELADGTITWVTGPRTLESHIIPTIRDAAQQAGRSEPRIVVGLPICLTSDPDSERERFAKRLAMYGTLPSYRAMLDREGASGAEDVAIVGDESTLHAALQRLRDIGVTDFMAVADQPQTLDFLQSEI
jgi:F420-dependent oxidoreductase-like protein